MALCIRTSRSLWLRYITQSHTSISPFHRPVASLSTTTTTTIDSATSPPATEPLNATTTPPPTTLQKPPTSSHQKGPKPPSDPITRTISTPTPTPTRSPKSQSPTRTSRPRSSSSRLSTQPTPPNPHTQNPQNPHAQAPLPYAIGRTPSNNLSIYQLSKRGGNLKLTHVKKITGDAHAFRRELSERLGLREGPGGVEVNSVTGGVVVKVCFLFLSHDLDGGIVDVDVDVVLGDGFGFGEGRKRRGRRGMLTVVMSR